MLLRNRLTAPTRLMSSERNNLLNLTDGGNFRHREWRHVCQKQKKDFTDHFIDILKIIKPWKVPAHLPVLKYLISSLMICCFQVLFLKTEKWKWSVRNCDFILNLCLVFVLIELICINILGGGFRRRSESFKSELTHFLWMMNLVLSYVSTIITKHS